MGLYARLLMDRSNVKDAGLKARAPARLAPANLVDRHFRGDAAQRAALHHRFAAIAAEHARAARVVHAVARIDRDIASPCTREAVRHAIEKPPQPAPPGLPSRNRLFRGGLAAVAEAPCWRGFRSARHST